MSQWYHTQCNGSRSWMIHVQPQGDKFLVDIYTTTRTHYIDAVTPPLPSKKVFSYVVEHVWLDHEEDQRFLGSTILLHVSAFRYVFIDRDIYEFESYSPIVKFCSPMGNSNVPYPYAIDADQNVYLLIENDVLIRPPTGIDPYEYYYQKRYTWTRVRVDGETKEESKARRNLRTNHYPHWIEDEQEARQFFETSRAEGWRCSLFQHGNRKTTARSARTYIQWMRDRPAWPFAEKRMIATCNYRSDYTFFIETLN